MSRISEKHSTDPALKGLRARLCNSSCSHKTTLVKAIALAEYFDLWTEEDEVRLHRSAPALARKRLFYQRHLRSHRWRMLKQEKMRLNGGDRCEARRCPHGNCDLHHMSYERIGNERQEDVVLLCRIHHMKCHRIAQKKGVSLRQATKLVVEGKK